jgi:putative transposase
MAKRKAVGCLVSELGLGERRSCPIVGLSRSVAQYRPVEGDDGAVVARMRALASEHRRYGCPRLHAMLRRGGLVVNHKRTERLYHAEGFRCVRRGAASCPGAIGCPLRFRIGRCNAGRSTS